VPVAPGKKQSDKPEISGTEGATTKSLPLRLATVLSADDWLVVGWVMAINSENFRESRFYSSFLWSKATRSLGQVL